MSIIRRSIRSAFLAAIVSISYNASADPNDVAMQFFQNLQEDNYSAAAGLFDPAELGSFRDLMRFIYENTEDSNDELLAAFFGEGATGESVAGLSDADFFASFLALVMNETKKKMPMGFSGVEALGFVSEDPDKAHVVTRFNLDLNDSAISMVDVVSVRRVDGDWKILMQADMKALANQLKAMYGTSN